MQVYDGLVRSAALPPNSSNCCLMPLLSTFTKRKLRWGVTFSVFEAGCGLGLGQDESEPLASTRGNSCMLVFASA
ncbi:hypothetical protein IF1G_11180 [Cordyceps javanica]|uniref:Uncharacterized protein n=1 Tax=Cordyceps javanica TaxID=43265 RepID=A0A545UKZ7_9HYPO|nr:hypothetical protein IF1G_11180 [Cordyceps javanica]